MFAIKQRKIAVMVFCWFAIVFFGICTPLVAFNPSTTLFRKRNSRPFKSECRRTDVSNLSGSLISFVYARCNMQMQYYAQQFNSSRLTLSSACFTYLIKLGPVKKNN
uniref:Uncharacterized protein n=1 Tax=Glossina pallidipes TaxID=7398 RepID=A0A1A9Z3C8_GLOPL